MEKRAYFSKTTIGIAFAAPMVVLIFVFFYWPAGQALYWAFTLQDPWSGANRWVGFANLGNLLADPVYWNSIVRSLVFGFASTGLAMGVALVMALCVDRELKGYRIYRSVFVWPYAFAAPGLALAFRFILAPEAGMLAMVNKIWPGAWEPTLSGNQAMIAVIGTFAWKYIGYDFIFLVAALQAIPRSLIEAAALDGSGPLRRIRDIQMPLMMPTLFFLAVMDVTESFQDSFGIVDIMTGGGPARSTEIMVYKIYFDGFKGLDYSGAAAQSVIMMLLVMALTAVQFRYIERRIHYS